MEYTIRRSVKEDAVRISELWKECFFQKSIRLYTEREKQILMECFSTDGVIRMEENAAVYTVLYGKTIAAVGVLVQEEPDHVTLLTTVPSQYRKWNLSGELMRRMEQETVCRAARKIEMKSQEAALTYLSYILERTTPQELRQVS